MGRLIKTCDFCAKRGRMRHDGFCSAKCAMDYKTKRSAEGGNGNTAPSDVARMIREADKRARKK